MLFDISEAEKRIGYVFKQKELLRQAFTHSSYAAEKNTASNQRMEYLGDSVLNFVVADILYRKYNSADEKYLTNMRSGVVRRETLYNASLNLNLEELLLFGEGERKNDKREKVLEDLLEAVTGAIYLDGGISAAAKFVKFALAKQISGAGQFKESDSKSSLSEISQKKYGKKVNYVTLKKEGSPHSPLFTVAAVVNGIQYKSAVAGNTKQAQQLAAAYALQDINGNKKKGDRQIKQAGGHNRGKTENNKQ